MQQVARPYITVGVVLAATSLVVATPAVTPSLPDVQVPNIDLTADADGIVHPVLGPQIDSDTPLGHIASPDAFDVGQANLFEHIFTSGFPAGQPALADLSDIEDILRADPGGFLGLVPGLVPPGLLDLGNVPGTDAPAASFQPDVGASQFGGAEGASAQGTVVSSEVSVLLTATSAAASQLAATLATDVQAFDQSLVAAETAFNTALVSQELAMEQAAFGSAGALNGVVNQGFNAVNMTFDAQEQSLNDVLGVTGPGFPIFDNGGGVGDVQAAFDQNLPIFSDIAGLQPDEFSNLLANFDGALFSTALQGFFTTMVGGPFWDVIASGLTPIFTDVSDSIFGAVP